jgi:hypothetical protein
VEIQRTLHRDASQVSANSGISGFSAISGGGLSVFSNEMQQKAKPQLNNWTNSQSARLNPHIVTTIVQKLGYSEDEVSKYVKKDPNSFVGVLYHKLLEDHLEKQGQAGKLEEKIRGAEKTQSLSSSDHNISAKLPI